MHHTAECELENVQAHKMTSCASHRIFNANATIRSGCYHLSSLKQLLGLQKIQASEEFGGCKKVG